MFHISCILNNKHCVHCIWFELTECIKLGWCKKCLRGYDKEDEPSYHYLAHVEKTNFLNLHMEALSTSSSSWGYHTWLFNNLEKVDWLHTTYTLNDWGFSTNKQHIAITCDELSRIDKHTWTSDHACINISLANPHLFRWRGLKGCVVLVIQQST